MDDKKSNFYNLLTSIFGFRFKSNKGSISHDNIEFVKVDPDSQNRFQHAKIGKIFSHKSSEKLEKLFKLWLTDTTDNYETLRNRKDRLIYIDFALTNDPYLSQAADLYADEATQLDEIKEQLIDVDCADQSMKYRILQLIDQWNITQNRVRSAIYNLAVYGDSFWSVKVTDKGVIRIIPLDIYQVKERLEFNPIRLSSDLELKNSLSIPASKNLIFKLLLDIIENESNEDISDIFDSKLFGYVLSDDLVVPPWNIVHFRLNPDQSPFYPYGTSLFLKAIAPYRALNATLALQGLARLVSFPITLYKVKTTPGMDEMQQFERINELREEYENIGTASASDESYSINTKIWLPDGLLNIETVSPDVKIDAIGDIQLLQERVMIASGIPKGFLNENWGGFGTSAVSLIEQWKPFARRVYTLQSAFLDGLSFLIRLHFAITGEYDYTEPFLLSLRFPQSQAGEDKLKAKQNSLSLTKDVIDLIKDVIGNIDDPLPEEILKDILSKFSFLSPSDIDKWVKLKYKKSNSENSENENMPIDNDLEDLDISVPSTSSTSSTSTPSVPSEEPETSNVGGSETKGETEPREESPESPEEGKEEQPKESVKYLSDIKKKKLLERYESIKPIIYESIIKKAIRLNEFVSNNRHIKYTSIFHYEEDIFKVFKYVKNPRLVEKIKVLKEDQKLTWENIENLIND